MDEIWLENDLLQARIAPLGAALLGLRWRSGEVPLILEFVDGADPVIQDIWAGVVVGPVANRLRTPVPWTGERLDLPVNEPPQVCLHGAAGGLSRKVWQVQDRTAREVTLHLSLADGAGGLPGNRSIWARYTLDGATLKLRLTAQTDAPTLFAPAHHPYWTLGHEGPAGDFQLTCPARHMLPVDDAQVPTGEIRPVDGTIWDFRGGAAVDGTLDHTLCIAPAPAPAPRPVATLTAPGGMSVDVTSTEPGLQVYAGAGLPDVPASRTVGPACRPGQAIALEPQFWPNAPHHAHFPQITLEPGRVYTQVTQYSLNA